MAAAALGGAGLLLGAAGQVSQLNAQRRQARAQEGAIQDQLMMSQQRLELASQQSENSKFFAKQAAEREQLIIATQRQQQQLQITEQVINNRMEEVASKLREKGISNEATQAAMQILGNSANEVNQLATANQNELSGLYQAGQDQQSALAAQQVASANSGSSNSQSASVRQGRQAEQLIQAEGQVQNNVDARNRMGDFNNQMANQMATLTGDQGNLAASYEADARNRQAQANALWQPYARGQVNLQAQRNRLAANTSYQAAAAEGNLSYLNQVMQERAQMSGLEAQRASIQKPSFLSYASVAVGAASGAQQMGLLSFGSRGGGATSAGTQNSPGLANMTQQWFNLPGIGQSSNINSMPPGYMPSNPLRPPTRLPSGRYPIS